MNQRSDHDTGILKPVLHICTDIEGKVIERPNRFLAIVELELDGVRKHEKVHVHDPGRLTDLIYPGNRVLLRKADSTKSKNKGKIRKTGWDMIAARFAEDWILVNSAFHREISGWAIENGIIGFLSNADSILPEQKYGTSRLDYLLEKQGRKIWIEVKGCTLAEDGVATFPDAPTTRGKRHLEELMHVVDQGDEAAVIMLIFRPQAKCFTPNRKIDPDFSETMLKASEKGVRIFPLQFSFKENNIYYVSEIPLCF
ncbi:DNA/RNA nuclease SfsA [Methanolobus sp. WCC5]|uniref:DNA/RNA nuclease SfsA n=1 Tax=Methanolobus sp. WCC5 TaxID=3125785 RepID=UPI00324C335D